MRTSFTLILAGILCFMLAVSGCTNSSSPATATPVATAAAAAETTAAAAAATPVPEAPSWSGTWNSTWLETNGNQTVSVLTLAQAGPDVSGNYSYTYPDEGTFSGSLAATVEGKNLSGSYSESDNDMGFFVFELAEDRNSFNGRWVHAENKSELETSALYWNGARE